MQDFELEPLWEAVDLKTNQANGPQQAYLLVHELVHESLNPDFGSMELFVIPFSRMDTAEKALFRGLHYFLEEPWIDAYTWLLSDYSYTVATATRTSTVICRGQVFDCIVLG